MSQDTASLSLLDRCAAQVEAWGMVGEERSNLLWCTANFASLRYDLRAVQEWLRRVGVIDTPLMQSLRAEVRAEDILTILVTRNLPLSPEQEARIRDCQDLATLEAWLRRAVTAASVAEVLA